MTLVAPETWTALKWTAEKVPLFVKAGGFMLGKLRGYMRDREVRRVAAMYEGPLAVHLYLVVNPETPHFIESRAQSKQVELRVCLRAVGVAPVGIRVNRIALAGTAHSLVGGSTSFEINESCAQGFFAGGEVQDTPLTVLARSWWSYGEAPKDGEAVRVELEGEVRILGPWASEYYNVRFARAVYVRHRLGN